MSPDIIISIYIYTFNSFLYKDNSKCESISWRNCSELNPSTNVNSGMSIAEKILVNKNKLSNVLTMSLTLTQERT